MDNESNDQLDIDSINTPASPLQLESRDEEDDVENPDIEDILQDFAMEEVK